MNALSFFQPKTAATTRRLLQQWKQGDEDEKWAEKAIEAFVKKLKNKKGAMEKLDHAIQNGRQYPDENYECVTIPRSQDGRLQVSHRKGLPHVIACRVWRWPDLQSHHELKARPCCQFPFESTNNKEVCINPYHYQRIESQVLPPVLVPRFCEYSSRPGQSVLSPFHQMDDHSMPANFTLDSDQGSFSPDMGGNRRIFSPHPSLGSQPSSPFVNSPYPPSPPYSPRMPNHLNSHARINNAMEMDEGGPTSPEDCLAALSLNENSPTVVPLEEPAKWCTVQYFELNSRVGEPFHVLTPGNVGFTIDGFTDPSACGRRFSLGQLSNIHRNSVIENTRKFIQKGVHICYVGGEVYAQCLSVSAIFIQSKESNARHGLHPSTIIKLKTGHSQRIFSMEKFARLLQQAALSPQAYEDVYNLQNMCIIRMSFVKGWGAEYNRQDVTGTPCWIEMKMAGPLEWLDKTLTQLTPPPNYVGSQS